MKSASITDCAGRAGHVKHETVVLAGHGERQERAALPFQRDEHSQLLLNPSVGSEPGSHPFTDRRRVRDRVDEQPVDQYLAFSQPGG